MRVGKVANSKLLKFGNQYDIMEELKDLYIDELKSLIAMIKKR